MDVPTKNEQLREPKVLSMLIYLAVKVKQLKSAQ